MNALIALVAFALQAAPAASAAQEAPLVIVRAAHMLDVASGKIVDKAEVRVRGKQIAGVGKTSSAPGDASVIDLGDMTLLPGLIDMHTHLTMQISPDSRNAPVHDTSADE